MTSNYRPAPVQKNAKRQLQGMVSRAQGGIFEQLLDASCGWYEARGDAMIEKTPEPMRPIRKLGDGKYLAVFTKKAQPDYKGMLSNGRMVMFEAKHTDGDRIEKCCVSNEQADRLEKASAMGAVCFVVVSFSMREIYRVPWKVWRGMKELYGHKYATPEELSDYRITFLPNGVVLFLEGLPVC